MKILVTGGAGYIGSHFVRLLGKESYTFSVLDSLSRGNRLSVNQGIEFYNTYLTDRERLFKAFQEILPDVVVHFAGFAYVGESVSNPGLYYHNNVNGALNLLDACHKYKVKNFIFSSTCSLYGNSVNMPVSETELPNPFNPYARTKHIIEGMLYDYEKICGMKYVSLRYFNAGGADDSGEIGEKHDPETHLIPLVIDAALNQNKQLNIFGNDYDTPDGTCVRDYIHVNDLALAHLNAIYYLQKHNESQVINLGTGKGNSVLEIIKITQEITGNKINYNICPRRDGDPAILIADNRKAAKFLNWVPQYDIDRIINTAVNWHKNPRY